MATLELILQAATRSNHGAELNKLFALPGATRVLISVAFVRAAGVAVIAPKLKGLAATAFVGIRNDITSMQGLLQLLAAGVKIYGVDTGSRQVIFHPKLYLAKNATVADAIIGSANLTFFGLHNNIEVSSRVKLDLGTPADAAFVANIFDSFDRLVAQHPQHVIAIKSKAEIESLFDSGRLVDETLIPAPVVLEGVKKGQRDKLPPMKLSFTAPPVPPHRSKGAGAGGKPAAVAKAPAAGSAVTGVTPPGAFVLVWQSKGMTQRDLNIPTAKGTNPTGSIGLKQGAYVGIDHRHYFRDVVFDGLPWVSTAPGSKREATNAVFDLVVKNLNYGQFTLRISHNGDTTTASYKQHNMTTHLHWGDAKPHVGKADLLGRTLFLYRRDTVPPQFMIEID